MQASRKNYFILGCIAFGVWLCLFKAVGLITQNFSTEAYHFPLDYQISITPLFVWPYFLAYVIPFAPFLFKMNYRAYNQSLIAIFLATLSAFWVYSTFPYFIHQPELGASLSERLLQWQYDIDFKPGANKMPALHVVLPLIIATYFAKLNHGFLFKSIWYVLVVLICISALFTKQHVLIDVLLGIIWATGAYGITHFLFKKHNLHALDEVTSLKKAIPLMLWTYVKLSVVAIPLLLILRLVIFKTA